LFLLAALLGSGLCGAAEASYGLQGRAAPDFALRATSGSNFRLSEHRGEVVMLMFWGSRCGQCGPTLARLSRLVDTYRSAGLAAFAVGHPVSFPVLLDPAKGVAREYRVDNLPMLLLVDRAGVIRYVHRNYRSGSDALYLEQVKVLLDE
jgi:peroxiredoxin